MTVREELTKLYILRGKILEVMIGSADKSALLSYSINDSDGAQSTTRRNPGDLMAWLKDVDNKIAELEQKQRGGGIRTFGTRMRP
ncbi:MAG: hypothetical protein LBK83_01385, partial [Treponema sp.]|nr:hypothetical protein [Treponema sp.]